MLENSKNNFSEKINSNLDAIVNGYSGFMYTVSTNYKIKFMNKTLIDYIGHDAIGEDCFYLIHGLDKKCSWCPRTSVLAGEPAHFEYKSPRNNRWYYYVSTPRINAQGDVVAHQLIAIDIHDRSGLA